MAALLVLSHQQRPDLLVVSGDITQRACVDQFRRARAFVDQLGVPLLALNTQSEMIEQLREHLNAQRPRKAL